MKPSISPALYWTPRILSLAFVAFLMLFSLDVFGEGLGFWGTLLLLFMHNLPALILLALTIASWKHELVGGITFLATGLLLIVVFQNYLYALQKQQGAIPWYIAVSRSLMIIGPAFLIGALYLVGWYMRKKIGSATTAAAKP
jgi:hypothetical protein